MHWVWGSLMISAIVLSVFTGTSNAVMLALTASAQQAITVMLGLGGILMAWLGLLQIAQSAGLINGLARALRPLMRWLYPSIPRDHPAQASITLNLAANLFGLGNAATPFGLKAMTHLQSLNNNRTSASDAMCLLLAMNTSSLQLVPVTGIAILATYGDVHPGVIILPTLIATSCSTAIAVLLAKWCARWWPTREEETHG